MPVCLANSEVIVTLEWTSYWFDKFLFQLPFQEATRSRGLNLIKESFLCENIISFEIFDGDNMLDYLEEMFPSRIVLRMIFIPKNWHKHLRPSLIKSFP